jgi:predicted CXXCH cytochrome family protein
MNRTSNGRRLRQHLAAFLLFSSFPLLLAPAGSRCADLRAPPERCGDAGCHEPLLSSGVVHRPVAEEKCNLCHLPAEEYRVGSHDLSSFETPSTKGGPCFTCHPELERALSATHRHGPFGDRSCGACHDPHGSPRVSLLLKAYPAPLYTRYGNDKYALCWDCHDQALAADKFTVTATGFRRGKRNFHYSHLHKGKGMTCRACHAVHASGQPFIMRSDGPAGVMSWNGKQVFQPLPGGGRCSGGCHTDVSYSR